MTFVFLGDVLDTPKYKALVETHDVIIHLAAIVGYPACAKEPELAVALNQTCVEQLVTWLRPEQRVIYASTGSCYGVVEGTEYKIFDDSK
jgi:nucleoside-diphosphate-sugar epimerase